MQARLDAVGLVVKEMPRSLAFYRRLSLDVPPEADGQPHVEHTLPGGLRLLWGGGPAPASHRRAKCA